MTLAVVALVLSLLNVAFLCAAVYNMWKVRICAKAALWYRDRSGTAMASPKPSYVVTYDRRWGSL
jgi:hypothetical protein